MADGPRNLIVLSDGTGNSAAKQNKTNVWRLYHALDLGDGRTQLAVFGDGVGTSSVTILRVLGLAFGWGVKRNVLNLYKFLCRNYNTGDHTDDLIWAFGFSRGAFTIRVLVGLICREGRVSFKDEGELNRNALAAYRAYRKKVFPASMTSKPWVAGGRYLRDLLISAWNRHSYVEVNKQTVDVHFVGLWDTAVAYGLPIDELTMAVDKWVWPMKFPNDTLSLLREVKHARHALSLDDERRTFHPTPWDETEEQLLVKNGGVEPGRLRQVWFAGTHSDVGGGYPDDGLAYVPLRWMIDEAAEKRLRFVPSVVEEFAALAAPAGRIYDSRDGFYGALYRYQPRNAHLLLNPPRVNPPRDAHLPLDKVNKPLVHGSVMTRMVCGNDGYAPISLPEEIDVLPPRGPPVPFEPEAVAQALAKDNEKRRHVLVDAQQLLPAASEQSATRTELFDLVQDTVWWRRVVYFVSLAFVVIAVAFPLLAPYCRIEGVTGVLDKVAGGLVRWTLGLIKGFLPGFAEPWVAAVDDYPAEAAIVLIVLLASLGISWFLQRRIRDRARAAWNVPMQGGEMAPDRDPPKPPKPGCLLTLARRARTTKRAVDGYRFLAQKVAPAFVLVLSGTLAISLVHRAVFDLLSTAGAFCKATMDVNDQSTEVLGDASEPFETEAMCHATGRRLIAGGKYRIRLEMDKEWLDKGRSTDVAGFAADGWLDLHFWTLPHKRWWWQNWFQPIARIGKFGNYEHVLQPAAPLPAGRQLLKRTVCRVGAPPQADAIKGTSSPATAELKKLQLACEAPKDVGPARVLISDITADATGELFLYVNDAVWAFPGRPTDVFYRNNSGTAKVTVKRILADVIE
jgi:uncharacterized protein (DUF2235 family)